MHPRQRPLRHPRRRAGVAGRRRPLPGHVRGGLLQPAERRPSAASPWRTRAWSTCPTGWTCGSPSRTATGWTWPRSSVVEHRCALDLRRGLLVRTAPVRRRRRAAHAVVPAPVRAHGQAPPGRAADRRDGRGLDRPATVVSGIDGTVTNSGVARYRDLSGRHLTVLAQREPDPSSRPARGRAPPSPQLRIAVAARTRVAARGGRPRAGSSARSRAGSGTSSSSMRATGCTGDDREGGRRSSPPGTWPSPTRAWPRSMLADAPGFDELLARHELAWRQLWRRSGST